MNTNNTNVNPFTRFDELMAERGFSGFDARLAAYAFIDKFRWFHRSEHDCPRPISPSFSHRRMGRYGVFAPGLTFNMTTVYNWCAENDESPFELLKWLDEAAATMDECFCRCEAAYWRARLGEDAFDDNRD